MSCTSRSVARRSRSGSMELVMSVRLVQVGAQRAFTLADARDLDVLLTRVREVGVTGAEVDRGNAERGKPRHVGPPELGDGLAADRFHELSSCRLIEPGQSSGGGVG